MTTDPLPSAAKIDAARLAAIFALPTGAPLFRVRLLAFLALAHAEPGCSRAALARAVGDLDLASQAVVATDGGREWLTLARLNAVCAAIGAPAMGERCAARAARRPLRAHTIESPAPAFVAPDWPPAASLTAALMGDPPPGRSAWDRRRGAGHG